MQEDCWYSGTTIPQTRINYELRLKQELIRNDLAASFKNLGCNRYSITELKCGYPERFFFFKLNNITYFGTKTISELVVNHNLPGLFCSKIFMYNILGQLDSFKTSEECVSIAFESINTQKKEDIFMSIKHSDEIYFPFAKYNLEGKEISSPKEGWFITEERAEFLSMGEIHFREYSTQKLLPFVGRNIVLFDPACSTGKFLSDIKKISETFYTIGQDLSLQMVEYAKKNKKINEIHYGDALNPKINEESVDVVFSRFLNTEVVATQQARNILVSLVRVLKKNGVFILFGHTPVLLNKSDLVQCDLEVQACIGRMDNYIFQYYECIKSQ